MKKQTKISLIGYSLVLALGMIFMAPQQAQAGDCKIKKMKVGFLGICSGEGDSCVKFKGDCSKDQIDAVFE